MLNTITLYGDGPVDTDTCHKISDIKSALHNKDRVYVFVDEKFFCSLDISQVVDLKIKIGRILTADELVELKRASDFSKFYAQALAYTLLRPHSEKELRDYLRRKTLKRLVRVKNHRTNEYQTKEKPGYDVSLVEPVFTRLKDRGYLDDHRFAELWVENRNTAKGMSLKKLNMELRQKGISQSIINDVLGDSERNDRAELHKIILRKRAKYPDREKFAQYLMRQGFNYSDVLDELSLAEDSSLGA